MKAYVFPGQGAQFPGMGKDLYEASNDAKEMFEEANEILGFSITDIMFSEDTEALKQTKVTQPAIFLHSVILAKVLGDDFNPEMVAGHSLGEFSALVSVGYLLFEDGLTLVSKRALAMQKACEQNPSTMAAVLGLENEVVENICSEIDEVVVPANYNCPGQLVISGEVEAIEKACEVLTEKVLDYDKIANTQAFKDQIKMKAEGLDKVVLDKLSLPHNEEPLLTAWNKVLDKIKNPKHTVNIGLVGKYIELKD